MNANFLSYQSVKFRSKSIKISMIYSQNKAKNALNLRNIGTPLNPTPYPLKTHNLHWKMRIFLIKSANPVVEPRALPPSLCETPPKPEDLVP